MARRGGGFSMLEVVVALSLVGIGVSAILGLLAQARRSERQTLAWAREEIRATELLMDHLRRWELLRSDPARRNGSSATGEDPLLGPWTWSLELEHPAEGRPMGLCKATLRWRDARGPKEAWTHAALRTP